LTGAFALLATVGQNSLPEIMQGNHYTPVMIGVVSSVWALSLIALVLLWRRRPRSVLDLWLLVVMCAWLFDIALSAVLNAGRFDVGFYAGRVFGLLAASFVLIVLLLETGILYARLVELNASERKKTTELLGSQEALRERTAELQQSNTDLERASQAKDRFFATMSHELRTPLNAIIGFTGVLSMKLSGPLTLDQEHQLKTVQSSAKHLLALVNDLLDVSKVEAGKIELHIEPIVCQIALKEVFEVLRPEATRKDLTVTATLPETDVVILTDRRALHQIILNLVNNAVKFTERGGIHIALKQAESRSRRSVEISIADTGIGIREADQQRLFSQFSQVKNVSAKQNEGTGLGLYLSQKLAGLLGGEITLRSEYGKGSTFTLTLIEP
jgi:signal transduction histidine kinase